MAGVIQGLTTGYGMVRDMQERDRRHEDRAYQRERQSALDAQNAERHSAQMANAGLQTKLLQNNVNRLPAQNKYQDDMQSANLSRLDVDRQVSEFNLNQSKKQATEADADKVWQNIVRQSIDPKTGQPREKLPPEVVQAYQQFASSPYVKLPKYRHLESADSAIEVENAFMNGGLPSIKHVQQTYQGLADKSVGLPARGHGTIARNEIVGMSPSEDGNRLKIKMVTYRDDGSSYESFVNNGRHAKPGTGVMELPWEKVFNDVQAKAKTAKLAKHLQSQLAIHQGASRGSNKLSPKDALNAANDIQKNITELSNSLSSGTNISIEDRNYTQQRIKTLQSQYDQLAQSAGLLTQHDLNKNYAARWANGDQDKAAFAMEFLSEGEDISLLEDAYQLRKSLNPNQGSSINASAIAGKLRESPNISIESEPFLKQGQSALRSPAYNYFDK
ncbi:hypothetical protein [Catenovulum sediminis]|uniref:Uncharacterized protein n=1 Tax=Catenovulum sediminis TaxID=1740262 RepID=A0ABV1RHA8_9ALTE